MKLTVTVEVDTDLTPEQIQESVIYLTVFPPGTDFNNPTHRYLATCGDLGTNHDARVIWAAQGENE